MAMLSRADQYWPRVSTALLLIDIQPDFMPGGGLAVEGGDGIIEPVRTVMASGHFAVQVATQDWHPPGHVSFASSHAGKRPFEDIELYGHPQTLWPDHCVQGGAGARLHPDIDWSTVDAIVRKGTDPETDSYSGFRNNWNREGQRPATGLAGYLRERGVTDVVICGLARDVCVKWTAEDAVDAGFSTWLIWDLTRPVDPGSDSEVHDGLTARRVRIIQQSDLTGA